MHINPARLGAGLMCITIQLYWDIQVLLELTCFAGLMHNSNTIAFVAQLLILGPSPRLNDESTYHNLMLGIHVCFM